MVISFTVASPLAMCCPSAKLTFDVLWEQLASLTMNFCGVPCGVENFLPGGARGQI